jgi:hypothetical protein
MRALRMWRSLSRALIMALIGAAAAGASLVIAFALHPDLTFDIDRSLPANATGFYPLERSRSDDFRWTARRAEIFLPGIDRGSAWTCSMRVRAGRPTDLPQPVVDIAIDGVNTVRNRPTNEFEDFEFTAPPRSRGSALILTITTTPPFTPGTADRRELGIQINRLVCSPAATGTLPPFRAVKTAVLNGAMLGLALGLAGLTFWSAVGATLLIAIAQAIPFSTNPAYFGPYLDKAIGIAALVAIGLLLSRLIAGLFNRQALTPAATFVIVYSCAALYLKLIALLHPAKDLVDAVFHAHRLEWVMRGRFFFTQPMPDGVQFPYAIALYVFSAPWTIIARDHVTLLRVVVCSAEAITGALLYTLVVRSWNDKLAGVTAVVLSSLTPLPFVIVGNANLTNAFGQSMALATMIAATLLPLRPGQRFQIAALAMLASVAFLSHVHTFGLLLGALVALALTYRLLGGSVGAPSQSIVIATVVATVFAVVVYYGHFGDAYRTLIRVRTTATASSSRGPSAGVDFENERTFDARRSEASRLSLYDRIERSLAACVKSVGWPIGLLTLIGIWRLAVEGARDRLGLALIAWGAAYVVFVAFGAIAPISARFDRYAAEFVGRVNYATLPALCVLAARGGAWMWRAGSVARLVSAVLLMGAVVVGGQQWLGWMWR